MEAILRTKMCKYCSSDTFRLFCNDCDSFVCGQCIVDSHQKHDLAKLSFTAESKRKQLDDIVTEGKGSLLSLLENNLTFIQENIRLDTRHCDVLLEQICNRASFIIKEVHSLKESYTRSVQNWHQHRVQSLEDFQALLKDVKEAITEFPAMTKNEPDTEHGQHANTILLEMKLQRALLMMSEVSKWKTTSKYTFAQPEPSSEDHDICTIKDLFGSLEQGLQNFECLTENTCTNDQFSTGRSEAHVSILDIEDAVCIDDMFSVRKTNDVLVKSGKSFYMTDLKKAKLFMSDIKDIAMTTNGSFLIIKNDDTCVLQVSPDGSSRVFANMCPCQPYNVFVSNSGTVEVVMQEEGHHPVIFAEFNKFGMKVKERKIENVDLSFVRFRKDARGVVYYIKMSYFPLMESVHILDENTNEVKRCPILGIFGYEPSAACRPIDACFDDDGRIIVTDHKNHAVYLQNHEGKFEQMLISPQQNLLTSPRSVLFVDGQLWIGCDDRKIHVFDYKCLVHYAAGEPLLAE